MDGWMDGWMDGCSCIIFFAKLHVVISNIPHINIFTVCVCFWGAGDRDDSSCIWGYNNGLHCTKNIVLYFNNEVIDALHWRNVAKYAFLWEKKNMKDWNKLCGLFNYIQTQIPQLSFSTFPLDLAFTSKDKKLFISQGSRNGSELI